MRSVKGFLFSSLTVALSVSNQSFAQTAPVALPAQMISNSGFEAVWNQVPGATAYQIEVSTDPNFVTTLLFTANPNDIPGDSVYFGPNNHITQKNGAIWYTVPRLSPSTKYYYRVHSTSGGLTSPGSNVIDVTTLASPAHVAPLSWVHTSTGGFAEVQSLIGDDDGNVYAAGHFTDTITVGSKVLISNGADDMFIVKLAADKTVLWAESIGGTYNDGEASLAIDSSGLYLVAIFRGTIDVDPGPGTQLLTNAGINDADGFYAKFRPSDGGLIWAHSLVDALPWSPACIGLDKSGVYIGGYFFGSSDLGTGTSQFTSQGENDIFFGKYDLTQGKPIWVKAVGGSHFDCARAIKVGADGVFVTGFFNGDGDWNTGTVNGTVDFDPSSGTKDLSPGGGFLAKYSLAAGQLIFAQGFTGTSNIMCNPFAIDINKSTVYIAGNFHGAVDFGASPNFQLTAEDIGGFIGAYNSSDGSAIWIKNIQTVHFIHPRQMIADNAGIYLSGAFGQSANFDPDGSSKGIRTSLNGYDNFVARYKPSGALDWVKTFYTVSIAAARTSEGYFVGGMFWTQTDFDPYQGSSIATPKATDMFIAKYVAVSPPFTPKALGASSLDTTSFTLGWKPVAGATSYSLDISTDNFKTFLDGYNGLQVGSTTKTISGLPWGTTYYYRVRAVNSYGNSDNSRVAKATTICAVKKPTIKLDMTDSSKPTLVSSSSKGNKWYLNGALIGTATGQTFLVGVEGSYTVQVTKDNCLSEMSDTQIVAVTGIINATNERKITVFPNPADQIANISLYDLTSNEPVVLEILDVMGSSVKTIHTYGGGSVAPDIASLAKGVYLVRVFQAEKFYHTKFVKE